MLDYQETNFEANERNPEKFTHGIYLGSTVESPINSRNYKALELFRISLTSSLCYLSLQFKSLSTSSILILISRHLPPLQCQGHVGYHENYPRHGSIVYLVNSLPITFTILLSCKVISAMVTAFYNHYHCWISTLLLTTCCLMSLKPIEKLESVT